MNHIPDLKKKITCIERTLKIQLEENKYFLKGGTEVLNSFLPKKI